jgi:protoheme IX farnesyltransferase
MKPTDNVTNLLDVTTAHPRSLHATSALASEGWSARLVDFYELTKPRMNALVIITTLVGFYMASHALVDWALLIHTILGTTLCAAGASVLNQYIERDFDGLMPRTRNRPLPGGRIQPAEALWFGLGLCISGTAYLMLFVNLLTALLGALTILSYVLVYTPMKRQSTLNTVVGAIPGAIPPMMGWTAVTNGISIEAGALFGILFLWQMPHFLAIAIMYRKDYELGGYKMLPMIDPTLAMTSRMIVLYTLALIPVSILPSLVKSGSESLTGTLYLIAALLLGLGFLWYGIGCAIHKDRPSARKLFFVSIIYLPLLLGVMMLDKG